MSLEKTQLQQAFQQIGNPTEDMRRLLGIQDLTRFRQFILFRQNLPRHSLFQLPSGEAEQNARIPMPGGAARRDGLPHSRFTEMIEQFGFDDVTLLCLIQRASLHTVCIPHINEAYAFLRAAPRNEKTEETEKEYVAFVSTLTQLIAALSVQKDTLIGHPFFKDIDHYITQAQVLLQLIAQTTVNHDTCCMTLHLNPEIASLLSIDSVLQLQGVRHANIFAAKRHLLDQCDLRQHALFLLTLAHFLQYMHEANAHDVLEYGVFPTVLPSTAAGFTMELQGFAHPIMRDRVIEADLVQYLLAENDAASKLLIEAGIIVDTQTVYRWGRGVTLAQLQTFLDQHREIKGDLRTGLLRLCILHSFQPFEYAATINDAFPVVLLTGPNGKGKSTVMRSIAHCVALALQARRIPAQRAVLTLCDGIFHDFDLRDDIQAGQSKFFAQTKCVQQFLVQGTTQSLAFFDELYHGTSYYYQLALAWATIEVFVRRRRRAVISTHAQSLAHATRPDGWKMLRGIMKLMPYASDHCLKGEGIQLWACNERVLSEGVITDSDAFSLAQEAGLDGEILTRAQELYALMQDYS